MSLLNQKMENAARDAIDSAEKFDAFESTARTTEKRLEDALETSSEAISTLGVKVNNECPTHDENPVILPRGCCNVASTSSRFVERLKDGVDSPDRGHVGKL